MLRPQRLAAAKWEFADQNMPGATSAAISATLRPAIRWGWPTALVAGVLVAIFAGPKGQPRAQPSTGAEAPLIAANAALAQARRAGDKWAARRLLALQFSFIDAAGKVHSRKEFLSDLKGFAAGPATGTKVRTYGSLAAVTGQRKAAGDTDVFFLDVWARQKGAWRALMMQDVPLVASEAPSAVAAADSPPPAATAAAAAVPGAEAKSIECKNPCQAIPYRVRSAAEQEVITAYQAIESAVATHDAGEWSRHVADEFALYRGGASPLAKPDRVAAIERAKEDNAVTPIGEVQAMRLAVYGDGAVMIATQAAPDTSRLPFRAARVFAKRNGQWQMAISVHTDIR